MTPHPEPTGKKPGFFREHVLPLVLVFLIPGFGWWFFGHAERQFDEAAKHAVLADLRMEAQLSDEEREDWVSLFETVPISSIMASTDPELQPLQEQFAPAKFSYQNFRWGKWIAIACLGSTLLAFGFVGLGVWYSLRSQAALYLALRTGWPVLRLVAVVQVIGQGVLAVGLSYWVTALWFESYFPKLILIIGVLALGAVALIIKAIFTKPDDRFEQSGELITEEESPRLWQRVREIAEKAGTAPPDQIIGGIDASFFVTEHEVFLDGKKLSGRTLFVSLPLLKELSMAEADAVLGHEMAHFSGDDTLWSRRISPLLGEMSRYLEALYQGAISQPVFHFMHMFWKLYQWSLGKMSRAREFRADRLGAEHASAMDLSTALIKVGAYCEYRGKTEHQLVEQRDLDEEIGLAQRLEHGFPAFLSGYTGDAEAALSEVPHPFDTHPSLASRVEALGLSASEALQSGQVTAKVEDSWRDSVGSADRIEQGLWNKQEELIRDVHDVNLAWSLKPDSAENIALIVRFFPEVEFHNKKGATATLDHSMLKLSDWEAPIGFSAIQDLELNDTLGSKQLTIKHTCPDSGKTKRVKLKPEEFKCAEGDLLAALGNYYGRFEASKGLEDS